MEPTPSPNGEATPLPDLSTLTDNHILDLLRPRVVLGAVALDRAFIGDWPEPEH